MQRINEVQFVLTQPEIPEVVDPFVSIKVLKSDISLVIKEGLIGKRMPIKSTHFEHKPDERVLDYIANRDSCLSQTNLRTGA